MWKIINRMVDILNYFLSFFGLFCDVSNGLMETQPMSLQKAFFALFYH